MNDELEAAKADEKKKWMFLSPRWIGKGYLWRLRILVTPWFSIFLHRIHRPDNQRDLHDHPWAFASFVLWGWYKEIIGDSWRQCEIRRRWFNWKRATGRHSISEVSRRPCWTLVFTGPRVRVWGFWILERVTKYGPQVEKWVPYKEYEKLNDA